MQFWGKYGHVFFNMFVVTFWPYKCSPIQNNCESCLWCFVWYYLILSTNFVVTLARNWGIFACLWDFNAISTRFIFLPYICTQLFDIPNLTFLVLLLIFQCHLSTKRQKQLLPLFQPHKGSQKNNSWLSNFSFWARPFVNLVTNFVV